MGRKSDSTIALFLLLSAFSVIASVLLASVQDGRAMFAAIQPRSPRCGDFTVQSQRGEECDDGSMNGKTGDFCSATCNIIRGCGNGRLEPGEQCDDKNIKDGDGCSRDCKIETGWSCVQDDVKGSLQFPRSFCERCGNHIKSGKEYCDHGEQNGIPGDWCSSTCTLAAGWHEYQENFYGTPSINHTRCGDGIAVKEVGEQCDLGDLNGKGFGCTADCMVELGAKCFFQPTVSRGACMKCGDGKREGDDYNQTVYEQCDDGNTNNSDGCSYNCKVEKGWTCKETASMSPEGFSLLKSACQKSPSQSSFSSVASRCGNGKVELREKCDDGNSARGDGCFQCKVETRWKCPGNKCSRKK